ncbi:peptidoglycan DD-metalloendopeptidase family protein [Oceanithermus sp.]
MRRRVSERYTILITRTGKEPRAFSFRPVVLLMAGLFFASWAGVTGYLYVRNAALKDTQARLEQLSNRARALSLQLSEEQNRNNMLAGEAADMLKQLDQLEAEIDRLRERAGLPKIEVTPVKGENQGGEGQGGGIPLDTEAMLKLTAERIKTLTGNLSSKIEPALEKTLAKEAARPVGYPLKVHTYIASGFGTRRNPFGRGYEFHDGIDLPAWYGTPIYATAPGKVVEAGWSNIYGYYVKLDHGYGYQTLYGHMSKILVKRGQVVKRGEVLGKVGSTGRSTGPHVHYSVYVWGKAVNPVSFLGAPSYAKR